jgi:ADP-heptose:LPS heptosyltransferase
MSKIAKQLGAGLFLSLLKVTGYSVKKISRFPEQEKLHTIAIFSTTALGDFLINTPAIMAIKARWPEAKLLLVMNKRNKLLAEGSPLFDEIIYWNGKANDVLPLAKTLRERRVEATFILHSRAPYDIVVASLARSRYIFKDVYYSDYQGRQDFALARYLSAFYDNRQNGNIHHIHQKTELLESVGIAVPSMAMVIPVPFTPDVFSTPTIGIHAGASTPDRCWPAEKFAQLIQKLLSHHESLNIELIGAPGEKALNQRIIDSLPDISDRVKNVAGETNLLQLAGKIAGFKALVVGDTGPLHVAIAVKTSTVGLYSGQSAVDGAAPLQDHDIHHLVLPADEKQGLRGIEVDDVYAAIERTLG